MFKAKLTHFVASLSQEKQRDLDEALQYAMQFPE